MAVADTDVNIFEDTENSGNGGGGGGGTDVTIYSSRNTLETEEVSPGRWDLNVKSETGRNFFVRNFHELMDAIQTIANLYISGDTVGNVIQLLGNIDMTAPTVDDEENYVLSNGDNLIDIPNKTYNLRQYLRYTKIVSYGSKRALQLLHPNSSRTAYDTWQLNVIRFTAENLSIGGDIAAWIGEFGHGDVGRDLPCEYQRYMFSSPGNILYDIKDCYITCCGANQTISNSFNPFLSMGSTLNAGLWVSSLNMTNCMFIAGRSLTTTDPNLNAPIVINCNWYESRSKTVVMKQMSKQVNGTELETGVPNIQIRTDNTSSATTAWASDKWEVTTDGTALIFCVLDDCMVFAPKLALNDLYLEGTPLTPPSATPTEDKVSLVEELIGIKNLTNNIFNINFPDNNGNAVMFLLEDLTELTEPFFFSGYSIPKLKNNQVTQRKVPSSFKVYIDYANTVYSIISDKKYEYTLRFCVVNYNSHRWFALIQPASDCNYLFVAHVSKKLEIKKILYSDTMNATTMSFFEETSYTTQVSVSLVISQSRDTAFVSFDGTTSQVVAGNGTLLNWNDKLGYWIGETANLPAVGSREANKLYITTDY